jgi:predicted nucleic acid-binding protein
MTNHGPVAVCDAGPLIHLDELGCLPLLDEFSVWVPEAVRREVSYHRPALFVQAQVGFEVRAEVVVSLPTLRTLGEALLLDAGEMEALALMAQVPQALFLTDDAAARLAAQQLGYRVHGTIGVLLRSVRRGQLSAVQVRTLLLEIPTRSSLHIRPALMADIMAQFRAEFGE